MKKQTTATVFPCRFPGCVFTTTAPQARGRHEAIKHKMQHGLVNGKTPATEPTPERIDPAATRAIAKSEITRAIEALDAQRAILLRALDIMQETL
jgi:hypothetical protein